MFNFLMTVLHMYKLMAGSGSDKINSDPETEHVGFYKKNALQIYSTMYRVQYSVLTLVLGYRLMIIITIVLHLPRSLMRRHS